MAQVNEAPLPLATVAAGVPEPLAALVMALLHKSPERSSQGAGAVVAALAALAGADTRRGPASGASAGGHPGDAGGRFRSGRGRDASTAARGRDAALRPSAGRSNCRPSAGRRRCRRSAKRSRCRQSRACRPRQQNGRAARRPSRLRPGPTPTRSWRGCPGRVGAEAGAGEGIAAAAAGIQAAIRRTPERRGQRRPRARSGAGFGACGAGRGSPPS